MSTEKNVIEAERWLNTAVDDLETAIILRKNKKFAHSCFHAQQAGEKAVKAVWYFADLDPWGHSIKKLIGDLESEDKNLYTKLAPLDRPAMVLDRFYIPTRYPNGLPDITPDVAFSDEDAKVCIDYSNKILVKVRAVLKF